MIIFRVTRAFYPVVDGAACHVWYLSKCQAEEGHNVFLFQPYTAGLRLGPPQVQMVSSIGRSLRGVSSRCKLAVLVLATSAAVKAVLLGRRIRPDVIHVHGDAIDAFVMGLTGRILRCPVVITLHGTLNTGAGYRFFAPILFRLVERFIVVSDSIARSLVDLGIPSDRIRSISSGIDLSRFTEAASAVPLARRPTIVSVGRLHPVKGYEYLIATASRLAEMGADCEIVVLGDGPDRVRLEALAAGSRGVRFRGQAGPAEVAALLLRADIFVLPSVTLPGQAEGTPTAVMEAMAAGLPVVATTTGGISDLVDHGRGGLLVPERDPVQPVPVVTVSEQYRLGILNKFHGYWKVPPAMGVIPLGVRLPDPPTGPRPEHADASLRMVFVGPLEARKNAHFLLDIAETLLAMGKIRFTLTFIGDGPDRPKLESQVKSRGLSGHVVFAGKMRHSEVLEQLGTYHILLHPSLKESFGYSLLEAKVAGLTVVASEGLEVPGEFVDVALPLDRGKWAETLMRIAAGRACPANPDQWRRLSRLREKYDSRRMAIVLLETLGKAAGTTMFAAAGQSGSQ